MIFVKKKQPFNVKMLSFTIKNCKNVALSCQKGKTKLNYQNTNGHLQTLANLSTKSGRNSRNANLIITLTRNAIYAFMINLVLPARSIFVGSTNATNERFHAPKKWITDSVQKLT